VDFARAFTEIADRAPPQEATGRPSWSKGTIPIAMPMRPSTPAFVVPSPLPSTPTLAHTPSGLNAMTPPPQALTVAPDGASGTLTNAASDTDVQRAAARAAARTRVLIAVGVVATLGAVIAALVPSAGHAERAAASAGPESSATAPAAPTGDAPPNVSAVAAAAPEPAAAPVESATAQAEPKRDEPVKHDEPAKHEKPAKPQAPAAPPPKATSAPAAATPRKSKVNCDPPFTVDADGIKHAKPECS
jgi:serine/threonine-protein kinase